MKNAARKVKRFFLFSYLVVLHIVAAYLIAEKVITSVVHAPEFETELVSDPTEKKEVPTPLPAPSIFADAATPATETPSPRLSRPREIIIPVEGVKPEDLVDSFSDARFNGRLHDAIDIPAPAGTPVLAAVDGEIIKFFDSKAGGITIYQLSVDRKQVYYYAHLQRRADNLSEGKAVKQGTIIGYVGDTGNAGAGNSHLHFSIATVADPKRYWEGVYLNPFPLLRN
ncbi:MAG TPA: M23 family metallopeptidase [Pyrinomonadaceae bacterium]|nr:M23 family metallopeptidase [Pyrinomonadaceae bacterium]